MAGVLDGIRVLDFGRYIAGPYCAALLGDFGAEVIRIEKIGGSEDRYITPVSTNGEGAAFIQCGRNKQGMTLNPTKPQGREVVRRLVATADVVVVNMPYNTLPEMGLDYDSLKAIKPDIILTTCSSFGSTGPYADKLGFDGMGQAMSGNMYMSGDGSEPMKSYGPYVDYSTAILCALGTVVALLERQKSGVGQIVEGSLLASAMNVTNMLLLEQAVLGKNRVASRNRGQTGAPADAFRTRDGWVLVQSVGQPLFKRWVELMGEPDWLTDPRFGDDLSRGEHGELISARMAKWCADQNHGAGSGRAGSREDTRRRSAVAPGLSGQQSRQGSGFAPVCRFPRRRQARPGGDHTGEAVAHSGAVDGSRTPVGRTHRRDFAVVAL